MSQHPEKSSDAFLRLLGALNQGQQSSQQFQPENLTSLIDSLRAVVGGDVEVQRNAGLLDTFFGSSLALGQTSPFKQRVQVTKKGERSDLGPGAILEHEFGHVAAMRNVFPVGEAAIRKHFEGKKTQATNVDEELANSFSSIYLALQQSAGNSDQSLPDFMKDNVFRAHEKDLVVDVLNTEIFRGHPLQPEAQSEQLKRTPTDLSQDATKTQDQSSQPISFEASLLNLLLGATS